MSEDSAKKFPFRLIRQMPPWAPVELGGKGERKAPDLCRVQAMGSGRGIAGMIFMVFDPEGDHEGR